MEHAELTRLHGEVRRFLLCGCKVGQWGTGDVNNSACIKIYTNTALENNQYKPQH
jgi:hypothetical protein